MFLRSSPILCQDVSLRHRSGTSRPLRRRSALYWGWRTRTRLSAPLLLSLLLSERRVVLASPVPKAFGYEGTARPGVEESPKSGIKGAEIPPHACVSHRGGQGGTTPGRAQPWPMKDVAIEGVRGVRGRGPAGRGARRTRRRSGSPFPGLVGESEFLPARLWHYFFRIPR
jgi:hypothetical protein